MEQRLMELETVLDKWNHSAGSLDGDAGYVEQAGEVWLGDAWFEREEWTLELSDREALSELFGVIKSKTSVETKSHSIRGILYKLKE